MDAIKETQAKLDDRLAEFKSEIRESQEKAATSAVRKAREPPTFRKKAHQEQHKFNEKIDEAMERAETELDAMPSSSSTAALDRAKEALAEGRKQLAERQKLIKIADRSDLGWAVVEEYTADELADDSGDEKRLEKAEKTAERKAAKRKKATEQRVKPYRKPFNQPVSGGHIAAQQAMVKRLPTGSPAVGVASSSPATPKTVGPCFACGLMGHLRSYCPKVAGNTKPWYPPLHDTMVNVCVNVGECSEMSLECQPVGDDFEWENSEDDCWEELESSGYCPEGGKIIVKGKLREHVHFWREELKAPESVIDVIEKGYVLPLKSLPPPYRQANHQSALLHSDFVCDSISELTAAGCVKVVETTPHVCSPLSVVQNASGKKRLVVNLRYLNRYLWKQKFKYEDLRTAMLLFEKDDYLFSFDLKSGYHHVDIAQTHHSLLGFEWEKVYYVFTVLPFGLSTACYIFTKLLRPLVRYWRMRGIRITVYLDDGLGSVSGYQRAIEASAAVRATLDSAGFVHHPDKSKWEPVHRLTWLGFVIDMAKGQLEVPQDKILALKSMVHEASHRRSIPAKRLASIIGKIISMGLAIGPVSRFMSRSLYAVLSNRHSWSEHLELTVEAQTELKFWARCISDYNAQPLWRSPSALRLVYSDASDTGYGGYVIEHGPAIAQGQWTRSEASQSSTWRELSAVLRVLQSVIEKLRNMRVHWFTDNQNVVQILKVGSRQSKLQVLAVEIFSLTVQNHVHLEPEWIPRELNQLADQISRIVDYDDWQLNPSVFANLDSLWGPHSVDRFASCDNMQLVRFNSRYWSSGTEAVDAFTVNWSEENNWLCPPISLIPRVIRHAQNCCAMCTLVVPVWPSAPFWPLVCPEEGKFAGFVTTVCELPLTNELFLPGRSGSVLFGGKVPNTPVYALRCQF